MIGCNSRRGFAFTPDLARPAPDLHTVLLRGESRDARDHWRPSPSTPLVTEKPLHVNRLKTGQPAPSDQDGDCTTTDASPDVNFASYWRSPKSGAGGAQPAAFAARQGEFLGQAELDSHRVRRLFGQGRTPRLATFPAGLPPTETRTWAAISSRARAISYTRPEGRATTTHGLKGGATGDQNSNLTIA
jgi:hypothetical protein